MDWVYLFLYFAFAFIFCGYTHIKTGEEVFTNQGLYLASILWPITIFIWFFMNLGKKIGIFFHGKM